MRTVLLETRKSFVIRKAFGKVGWGNYVSLRSAAIDVVDCLSLVLSKTESLTTSNGWQRVPDLDGLRILTLSHQALTPNALLLSIKQRKKEKYAEDV